MVHNAWVEDEKFQAAKVIPNVISAEDREIQIRDIGFLRHMNEMHLARLKEKDSDLEASIKTMGDCFPAPKSKRLMCSTSVRKARRCWICTAREARRWAV